MPPAPKSKVAPKFAFGAMSDSEEEPEDPQDGTRRLPRGGQGKGFDFGMMGAPEEQPAINAAPGGQPSSNPAEAPAQKRGYGLLGAEAKKYMNDRDQIQKRNQFGNLEIDLDQSNEQFMMQSQKLPGLKEYGFNEL